MRRGRAKARDPKLSRAAQAKSREKRGFGLPGLASGQLAVMAYRRDAVSGSFVAHHVAVLTLHGALIDEINAFHVP